LRDAGVSHKKKEGFDIWCAQSHEISQKRLRGRQGVLEEEFDSVWFTNL